MKALPNLCSKLKKKKSFVDFELCEFCTLSAGKRLPKTYFFDYLDSEDRDSKLKLSVGTYLSSFAVS